jgi:hypothetical protein
VAPEVFFVTNCCLVLFMQNYGPAQNTGSLVVVRWDFDCVPNARGRGSRGQYTVVGLFYTVMLLTGKL